MSLLLPLCWRTFEEFFLVVDTLIRPLYTFVTLLVSNNVIQMAE